MSKNEKYSKYFTFILEMLRGGMPVETDKFLNANFDDIREVARELYEDIPQTKIYRGIILPDKINRLEPHPNFTYISFSEDIKVAEHFADPSPTGFGSILSLGDYGYIVEVDEPYEILFHHSLFSKKEFKQIFSQFFDKDTLKFLKNQKEVTIIQPDRDLKVKPFIKSKSNPDDVSSDLLKGDLPLDDREMMGRFFFHAWYQLTRIKGTTIDQIYAQKPWDFEQYYRLTSNLLDLFIIFAPYIVHRRKENGAFINGFHKELGIWERKSAGMAYTDKRELSKFLVEACYRLGKQVQALLRVEHKFDGRDLPDSYKFIAMKESTEFPDGDGMLIRELQEEIIDDFHRLQKRPFSYHDKIMAAENRYNTVKTPKKKKKKKMR